MTNRRQKLLEYAFDNGIKVISAKSKEDNGKIAIHLLNPDLRAFEDAIDVALRDNFPVIVLHSNKTFMKF